MLDEITNSPAPELWTMLDYQKHRISRPKTVHQDSRLCLRFRVDKVRVVASVLLQRAADANTRMAMYQLRISYNEL